MGLVTLGHKARQGTGRPVGQLHGRLARGQVHHAHVAPVHAPAEAGAQRLGTGLLCGKTLGIGGCTLCTTIRFFLLDRREAALHEAVAETFERFFDAVDLNEVGTEADDHLTPWMPRLPGFTAGMAASSGGS
ncbi:hypothetical protein D3C87_1406670 [compost metagenome]